MTKQTCCWILMLAWNFSSDSALKVDAFSSAIFAVVSRSAIPSSLVLNAADRSLISWEIFNTLICISSYFCLINYLTCQYFHLFIEYCSCQDNPAGRPGTEMSQSWCGKTSALSTLFYHFSTACLASHEYCDILAWCSRSMWVQIVFHGLCYEWSDTHVLFWVVEIYLSSRCTRYAPVVIILPLEHNHSHRLGFFFSLLPISQFWY